MAIRVAEQLRSDYVKWLDDRTQAIERGNSAVLTTPFLNFFNDGIEIFVEKIGEELMLHDGGKTIEDLTVSGVRIEDSERRKKLIERALAGFGAQFDGTAISIKAQMPNFPVRLHFLISAILRLNDLWMSVVPRSMTDFFEMVKEFFQQRSIAYVPNIIVAGRSVEHEIDFIVPSIRQKERLVKIVGSPSQQAAKVIAFTWIDIKDTRAESDRVVLLNDLYMPDPFEGNAREQRQVSEQTVGILQAYSNQVLRWSDQDRVANYFLN